MVMFTVPSSHGSDGDHFLGTKKPMANDSVIPVNTIKKYLKNLCIESGKELHYIKNGK